MTRAKRGTLAWAVPGALVLAVSMGLTIRQGRAAKEPEPERFSGSSVVLRMPSLLRNPKLPSRVRVAVVRDESAASYYDPAPETLARITHAWRDALVAAGADVRIISSRQVAGEGSAQVLVIPSSPCLSVATREAIEMAGARGQGLILTGSVGIKDAGCRHLGYGLMVEITGASRIEPLEERSAVYVTIPYGGPLSVDIPPGARLDLSPANQVALRLPGRDAVYSDYTLGPAGARGEPLLDGAVAHSTYRGARVAYWGFELRDAVARPWNRAVLSLLVRNSVAWAGRLPLAGVEPWPNNRRAAAAFAQDVEDRFTNGRFAADSLRAIGIPGTYFLVSDLAARNRRLSRQFFKDGEVGTHTENHSLLGGMPAERQRVRLATTQSDLTDLVGEPVRGLRPPEEQFDVATMSAWLAAGGTYMMGVNDSRCVAPELLLIGSDTLVMLPRTGNDDFGAMGPTRPQGNDAVAELFHSEFDLVREMGGLWALSYHSQLLAKPEHLPALARIARWVASDTTVWVATTADIAGWWRSRADLHSTARMVGANELQITVRNTGKSDVRGAVIRVLHPSAMRAVSADGQLLPSEPGVIRVLIPSIAAGTKRTISTVLGPG